MKALKLILVVLFDAIAYVAISIIMTDRYVYGVVCWAMGIIFTLIKIVKSK